MKILFIFHFLFVGICLINIGCRPESSKIWVAKGESAVEYIRPKNLIFHQNECKENDSLILYEHRPEPIGNDTVDFVNLQHKEIFLKKLVKSKNEVALEIAFIDNCALTFLGEYKLKGDSLYFDYFTQSDSIGRVIAATCDCQYQVTFKLNNLPVHSPHSHIFMKGQPIEGFRTLHDVYALIHKAMK
jgi:hypothetical protein